MGQWAGPKLSCLVSAHLQIHTETGQAIYVCTGVNVNARLAGFIFHPVSSLCCQAGVCVSLEACWAWRIGKGEKGDKSLGVLCFFYPTNRVRSTAEPHTLNYSR